MRFHCSQLLTRQSRNRRPDGLVFGPTEVGEGLLEAGEGEAHDVEVTAFDAGNETAGTALDGVGAGFVVWFAGGEVAGDFFGIELGKMDMSRFDEGAALGVGKANEGDTGEDRVRAGGKSFEHVAGVVGGARLAEDVAVESDFGVGANDDGRANGAGGDEFGFGDGQAMHEVVRGFAGVGRFVDGGGEHGEGEAGVAKDFGAAGGGGGEDEFHHGSRISGGEGYYSASAVTACAEGLRKRRAGQTEGADLP